MSQKPRAELDLEVRYAETDQMGVVHHANYLVWFELARTHLCSQSGHTYAAIEKLGYMILVTGAQISYRGSARYGDSVHVASWIDWLGSRALRFAYEIQRDGDTLVTGVTDHVWVSMETRRPCRMPETLRDPFLRLARQEQFLPPRKRDAP